MLHIVWGQTCMMSSGANIHISINQFLGRNGISITSKRNTVKCYRSLPNGQLEIIGIIIHPVSKSWFSQTCWAIALLQSGLGRKELFMDQSLQSGWNQMLTSPLSWGSPLSAVEWVDDGSACQDEDALSDKRRRLDEGKRLTANFSDLCRTQNGKDVAGALFSCGLSRHQSSVRIESENVSKNVLPCLRQFDCLD